MKKATGEIVAVNQIHEKKPTQVKTYGIWLRYDSRSGTHNMYKEYRELTRCDAVFACCALGSHRHLLCGEANCGLRTRTQTKTWLPATVLASVLFMSFALPKSPLRTSVVHTSSRF